MSLSPKRRFQAQAALVKIHLETTDSVAFQDAAEVALLEYVAKLDATAETELAAANFQRIVGARDYLNVLLALAEQPKPPATPASTSNLKGH